MSFCTWINIRFFHDSFTSIITFQSNDENDDLLFLGFNATGIQLQLKNVSNFIPIQIKPLSTFHLCLSIYYMKFFLHINGELLYKQAGLSRPSKYSRFQLVLGSFSSETYVGNESFKDFSGRILYPAVWYPALKRKEIVTLCNCKLNREALINNWTISGDYIAWRNDSDIKSICEKIPTFFFSDSSVSYQDNVNQCRKLGAEPIEVEKIENNALMNKIGSIGNYVCVQKMFFTWLKSDKNCEALFININNSRNFLSSVPSPGSLTNIQEIKKSTYPCDAKLCLGCQKKEAEEIFVLKGLCESSRHDLKFLLKENEIEKPGYYLHGFGYFNITYQGGIWRLFNEFSKLNVAVLENRDIVGVKEWKIESKFCGKSSGKFLNISFTKCKNDEAICTDGSCINFSKKCDGHNDCQDGADEKNCQHTNKVQNYKMEPFNEMEIHLVITVPKIKILPDENILLLKLESTYRWSDPRLNFVNIQSSMDTFLHPNESIWKPSLGLVTFEGHGSRIKSVETLNRDEKTMLFVRPNDVAANAFNESNLYNDRSYSGENVRIHLKENFEILANCEYDFMFFPFDSHVCFLDMALHNWDVSQQILKGAPISRYTGPLGLKNFHIDPLKSEKKVMKIGSNFYSGFRIRFEMVRLSSPLILLVYLPSFLLQTVVIGTLWVSESNQNISFSISCLATLVFYLQSIVVSLYSPDLGYPTAIDSWLCFNIVFSILNLTLYILNGIFFVSDIKKEEEKRASIQSMNDSSYISKMVNPFESRSQNQKHALENVNIYNGILLKIARGETKRKYSIKYYIGIISKVVLPVAFGLFNLIYWSFVFHFKTSED